MHPSRRMARAAAACAALALAGAGSPKEADGPVAPPPMEGDAMTFIGIGSVQDCTGFLRAVAIERQAQPPGGADDPTVFRTTLFGALMGWADGYVTAKNETARLQRLAGSTTSMGQRARWLELFCQANPGASFFAAVYRLREYLEANGL